MAANILVDDVQTEAFGIKTGTYHLSFSIFFNTFNAMKHHLLKDTLPDVVSIVNRTDKKFFNLKQLKSNIKTITTMVELHNAEDSAMLYT